MTPTRPKPKKNPCYSSNLDPIISLISLVGGKPQEGGDTSNDHHSLQEQRDLTMALDPSEKDTREELEEAIKHTHHWHRVQRPLEKLQTPTRGQSGTGIECMRE